MRTQPLTIGVLLAAGASRRFGPDEKLLAPWRGRPLVHWSAQALQIAGCQAGFAVVSSPEVGAALPAGITPYRIEAGQPMGASFRAAITLARSMSAARLLVCLGDMPNIPAGLLVAILTRDCDTACIADGSRRPPILLMAESFDAACDAAQGDMGARAFIRNLPAKDLIALPPAQAFDVDRPGDLADGIPVD